MCVLRTGDKMLGISGRPYDTLEEVIGLRGPRHPTPAEGSSRLRQLSGNMREWGIGYDQVSAAATARVCYKPASAVT